MPRIDTNRLREISDAPSEIDSEEIHNAAEELDRTYAIEDLLESMIGVDGWLPKPYKDHVNAKLAAIGAASDKS